MLAWIYFYNIFLKVKWNQNQGQFADQNSVQSQIMTLIKSVQMVMRCKSYLIMKIFTK